MTSTTTRLSAVLTAVVLFLGVAGCSLDPSRMASSARSSSGGRAITVEFTNALNLPEGADVTVNGLRVGSVTGVVLRGGRVDVDTLVAQDARIAADATASIRQNTVLGDPYVAIVSSGSGAAMQGSTIPLARTTSPPPLEDTLAVLSNFIRGGSIEDIQDVMRSVNSAMPERAQTGRVARIASIDLASLASDTGRLDELVDGLNRTATTLIPRLPRLVEQFGPAGLHYWKQVSDVFAQIGIVLPSIGSIFEGGYWLMPLLTNVDQSLTAGVGVINAVGTNEPQIRKLFTDHVFPWVQRPSMNIVSISSPQGEQMVGTMTRLLRMIGATR